jgi:Phage tail assembly chaperone protein
MEIRIRATGAVMTEETFRAQFNSNVIPRPITEEWLDVFGADIVLEGPQATVEDWRYGFSYRDGVVQIGDKWFTKYSVGPNLTGDELAAYKAEKDAAQAAAVRNERNRKLAETDWTQVKDCPTAISDNYTAYRQALRDVPTQSGFPWEVVWPTV